MPSQDSLWRLGEIFNIEQTTTTLLYLNSEKNITLLRDLLQAFPMLISKILSLNITVFDVLNEAPCSKSFLTHLVRNIIPFRYSLKIENGKILFNYPASSSPVTSSVFQNWVKLSVRVLRTLMLKQAFKQPESQMAEFFNHVSLNSNLAVLNLEKELYESFVIPFQSKWKKTGLKMKNLWV